MLIGRVFVFRRIRGCSFFKYKDMNKLFNLVLAVLLGTTLAQAENVTVAVRNASTLARVNETVELNAAKIKHQVGEDFIVTANNKQIPYQLTYDGKLIFQVSVKPKGVASYVIKAGSPEQFKTVAAGRLHPERVDDMAWENDRIAFRCYGPALQKSGEKAYGNDVWVKCTKDLVCDFRYGQEERATPVIKALLAAGKKKEAQHYSDSISYHIDHGNGLDFYKVGPTLGAGTTGFLVDGKIIYPYCFTSQKVLDNGPIRFTVRLTYDVEVKGVKMTEVRFLSLDAGSQLNKVTVSYSGQKEDLPVVAGIVLHDGSIDEQLSAAKGYAAYAENNLQDGQIFVGMAFPQKVSYIKNLPIRADEKLAKEQGSDGHIIAYNVVAKGGHLTYYWGAGWSKWGFKNDKEWFSYMNHFVQKIHSPLQVSVH